MVKNLDSKLEDICGYWRRKQKNQKKSKKAAVSPREQSAETPAASTTSLRTASRFVADPGPSDVYAKVRDSLYDSETTIDLPAAAPPANPGHIVLPKPGDWSYEQTCIG